MALARLHTLASVKAQGQRGLHRWPCVFVVGANSPNDSFSLLIPQGIDWFETRSAIGWVGAKKDADDQRDGQG